MHSFRRFKKNINLDLQKKNRRKKKATLPLYNPICTWRRRHVDQEKIVSWSPRVWFLWFYFIYPELLPNLSNALIPCSSHSCRVTLKIYSIEPNPCRTQTNRKNQSSLFDLIRFQDNRITHQKDSRSFMISAKTAPPKKTICLRRGGSSIRILNFCRQKTTHTPNQSRMAIPEEGWVQDRDQTLKEEMRWRRYRVYWRWVFQDLIRALGWDRAVSFPFQVDWADQDTYSSHPKGQCVYRVPIGCQRVRFG